MTGNSIVTRLGPDVWYLVLQHVPDRNDLSNLCRVCKELNTFATQFLYRTITIGPPLVDNYTTYFRKMMRLTGEKPEYKLHSTKWGESLALVLRLATHLNGNSQVQAHAVREIDIMAMRSQERRKEPDNLGPEFEEELPGLVRVLPNLRHVRMSSSTPTFEELFRALHEHPNKPEIHLLKENGSRLVSGAIPGVVTIKAQVSPWEDTPEKPNTVVPDIEKLLFACPNLKSFSLSVRNNYGGCMSPRLHHPVTKTFQFASSNAVTFPPLEFLSLSGYDMSDEEWPHWRDGLDWSRLKILHLGPDPVRSRGPAMADLLGRFEGHATALRTLTVETWAAEGKETCPPLLSFLESFDTLEELTVNGHFIPVQNLARHRKLRRLCLHCIEVQRPEGSCRPTYGVADLTLLDEICPGLETLEIDISRNASGEWSKEVIGPLASSFSHLRDLTIHCEAGLVFDYARQDEPVLPLLDEGLVRAFAEVFFASRGSSRMEKLTIKTGEGLRRFPQWHPRYRRVEEKCTREFNAWLQKSDGEVKVEGCKVFLF
ncbi:hypothetical protein QBC37DRAFT_430996 [Rhypophila decipiens]|uniref:F-box domain-containing protein n=1 Tax=Rhypophila decipiens TaxID=261697 RepID=A0AAN6XYL9_9PEZI|nr:hypothetical protein QBC37DRAFT_430996 [Rhypophila decipiens]